MVALGPHLRLFQDVEPQRRRAVEAAVADRGTGRARGDLIRRERFDPRALIGQFGKDGLRVGKIEHIAPAQVARRQMAHDPADARGGVAHLLQGQREPAVDLAGRPSGRAIGADEPIPLDDPVVGQRGQPEARHVAPAGEGEELLEAGAGLRRAVGRHAEAAVVVVVAPHHRMAVAEGRHAELERHRQGSLGHRGLVRLEEAPVERGALLEHILHDGGVADRLQEEVHHHPLVDPGRVLPRQSEERVVARGRAVGPELVHQRIVQPQEAVVQLGHDQVLVVAPVADQRGEAQLGVVGLADQFAGLLQCQAAVVDGGADPGDVGQVVRGQIRPDEARRSVADRLHRPEAHLGGIGGVAHRRFHLRRRGRLAGAVPVEAVEVQPAVAQVQLLLFHQIARLRVDAGPVDVEAGLVAVGIGRDVVVDELAEVGEDRRNAGLSFGIGLGQARLGHGVGQREDPALDLGIGRHLGGIAEVEAEYLARLEPRRGLRVGVGKRIGGPHAVRVRLVRGFRADRVDGDAVGGGVTRPPGGFCCADRYECSGRGPA